MADLNKLVNSLASSGAVSGFAGGLAGSTLAGALSSKKGRKMAGSALKLGAVAAVGGLAYSAYQRYRQGSGDAGANHRSAQVGAQKWANIGPEQFAAPIEDESGSGGLLLMRAMIAAASADGHLDDQEQSRIFAELDRMSLTPAEKGMLFDELRSPLSMSQLVTQVTSPEVAVEVYTASLIAIDETSAEGQLYLRSLAAALSIPEDLVASLYEQAELARNEGKAA